MGNWPRGGSEPRGWGICLAEEVSLAELFSSKAELLFIMPELFSEGEGRSAGAESEAAEQNHGAVGGVAYRKGGRRTVGEIMTQDLHGHAVGAFMQKRKLKPAEHEPVVTFERKLVEQCVDISYGIDMPVRIKIAISESMERGIGRSRKCVFR